MHILEEKSLDAQLIYIFSLFFKDFTLSHYVSYMGVLLQ